MGCCCSCKDEDIYEVDAPANKNDTRRRRSSIISADTNVDCCFYPNLECYDKDNCNIFTLCCDKCTCDCDCDNCDCDNCDCGDCDCGNCD